MNDPHDQQVPGEGQSAGTPAADSERTWCILVHVLPLCGVIIPFGNIIAPLVVWLVKKEEAPQAAAHAKEVLNFQISATIYLFVAFILMFVVIGILLAPIIGIGWLVLLIMGAVKASNGEFFRYPITIRLIQ